jgi:S1-C subfamily serine protease
MKTKISVLVYLLFINIFSISATAHEASNAWKNAYKSTVIVLPTWPGYNKPGFGAPKGTAPAGTGFFISANGNDASLSNHIMTAAHVIRDSKIVEIENYNGKSEKVEIILIDYKTDIAILKSTQKGIPIKISKIKIQNGNEVCVIGNSFGLGQSLSCGIVSGVNRKDIGFNEIENFIQTDAAVNPGSSGAPLINMNGELEGMVDAIYTKEADIDAGVNFAIDKELIQEFLYLNNNKLN